ncbi:MAG: WD40 repeat domain-containing protein [Spirochaetales bacterium]|nr:WD40 repeat domain-containing protein [Spirochaetales bacterium]
MNTPNNKKDNGKDLALSRETRISLLDEQQQIFSLCNIKARNTMHRVGGHSDWIRDIAFTYDNERIVSGSDDCTARLWDTKTGTSLMVYRGHTDTVRAVAIHPDNTILATGSWDTTIRLWMLETGKCIKILKGHTARIRSILFSPDGNYLFSGSEDNSIRKWLVADGECAGVFLGHKKAVRTIISSGCGNYIFSGGEDSLILQWDTSNGECLCEIKGHQGEVFTLCLSSDNSLLFSGGRDRIIRIWDCASRTCRKKLRGHKNWVMSLCLHPDGKRLLSGDLDGVVKIWDIGEGTTSFTYGGPTWGVNGVRFLNDGGYCLFCSEHRVSLLHIATGNVIRDFKGHIKNVATIYCNKRNTLLATGGWDGVINLWNLSNGRRIFTLTHNKTKGSGILSVFISRDDRYLCAGSDNGYIMVWSLKSGRCIRVIRTSVDNIHGVCFTADNNHIIICCRELYDNIVMFDIKTGEMVRQFWGHENTVFAIDISDDGKYLASGSADNTARVWNIETGACIATLRNHTDWVETVRFSRDGRYLLTGGCDLLVRLFDIETESLVREYSGSTHTIYSVDIDGEATMIIAGGNDKMIRIWDKTTGKVIKQYKGNDYQLYAARFDRTGTFLVTGGKYSLKRWELDSGIRVQEYTGFSNSICAMHVNPYTRELVIGSWEFGAKKINIEKAAVTMTYRYCMSATHAVFLSTSGERLVAGGRCVLTNLLDARTGRQLRWFEHGKCVNAVILNARGDRLFTACSDHLARQWDINLIECVVTYRGHRSAVFDIKLSRDETRLYTAGRDGTIRQWDVRQGICLNTLYGHDGDINTLLLSWDEFSIFSGSKDRTIREWDISSGVCRRTIDTEDEITALSLTMDGTKIISGTACGMIEMRHRDDGGRLWFRLEHDGGISGLAVLDERNMIISSSYDGTVKFWTLDTGELRASYHNINEGFLWTSPPDKCAPFGRFWTDRRDIIGVMECEEDGNNPSIIPANHPERDSYMRIYNNKEAILKRINTRILAQERSDIHYCVEAESKRLDFKGG